MAMVKFELKDCNGVDTEIGDEIEVTYPEIEVWQNYPGEELEYYRPRIVARCKVLFPPSKGLRLKVIEVLNVYWQDDDLIGDFQHTVFVPGNLTGFRRTVWHWRKVSK